MTSQSRSSSGVAIVPPNLAVKAMRDSGYKNTAYALAELIDNAVQAKAAEIFVYCIEKRRLVSERERRQIVEIAVLDNGSGMTPDQLCKALQFGNGTHLNDRSGIGRFGMGLPNSSISQCRRVDVWTWQAGPDNAMHSYLDIDQIEAQVESEVPEPIAYAVPQEWRTRAAGHFGVSGTLVVWQNFDEHRLTWRSAKATFDNAESLVGRMYRKFIKGGALEIRLIALEDEVEIVNRAVRPNDPLYLTAGTCTPEPFDQAAMFQPWGQEEFQVQYNGATHKVVVRSSWAKEDTIQKDGAERGSRPYGKHAAKNTGVSILRAGRELELDSGWCNTYDPRERWWGMEVEFPPELDEVFGVPNNKQAAHVFSQLAHVEWDSEAAPGENRPALLRRLEEEGDPRAKLHELQQYIRDQLNLMRDRIQAQGKGRRQGGKRHEDPSVDDRASDKFKQRAAAGHDVPEDKVPFDAEAKKRLVADLTKMQYPADAAQEIADAVENRGRKVIFVDAEFDGFAFFKVEFQPAVTQVVFNVKHPVYDQLVRALDSDVESASDRDLVERIGNASDTLKLLFAAWARFEMEDVPNREKLNEFRHDWGRMAKLFLHDQ